MKGLNKDRQVLIMELKEKYVILSVFDYVDLQGYVYIVFGLFFGFWVFFSFRKKRSCDFGLVINYLCLKGKSFIKEIFFLI